jgi:DNA mismatch repair protein PMS2
MIRAIDRSSIQKICSGQVVVDLATAVKELVENALDAGATSIEVKLRDMGASMIEVSDNGGGISPSNYDGIAMKHFTSKLTDFEDTYSISSFGFRGEALNALCELSGKFSITTRQTADSIGTLLEFDKNGR